MLFSAAQVAAEEGPNQAAQSEPAVAPGLYDREDPLAELFSLMRQLPEPPLGEHRPFDMAAHNHGKELDPAIFISLDKAVEVHGKSVFQSGPADGLEVLLALQGGKNHEAFAWTPTGNAELLKTAFLLALALEDGQVADEERGVPARGTPLRVVVRWQPDVLMFPDRWVEVDASELVFNRGFNRGYPALPYIYTGSHLQMIPVHGDDGKVARKEHFMLNNSKSIAVNYDEPDALLASPFPEAGRDMMFEVYGRIAPRAGTKVQFAFSRAELPLTLTANESGELSLTGQDTVLEVDAIASLLRKHYHRDAKPELFAVAVQVPPQAPRALDEGLRIRLLKAAVQAESWVVPVFTLPPME
jgi:hypothetical protein